MRTLAQSALAISLAAALLAGCGGSQPLIGAPGAMPQAEALAERTSSTNYKVVYRFAPAPDGNFPAAGLIDMGGTLYGTTWLGGANACGGKYTGGPFGCGTVYSITPSGTEKVLYSFGGLPDGSLPDASLIAVGGALYGTTTEGGKYCASIDLGCGTVFSVTTGGTEHVLHRFGSGTDGITPEAPLIEVAGTLYSTTNAGGTNNSCGDYPYYFTCGTVFRITPSRNEKVLHSFANAPHGNWPAAGLIDVGGTLYGTTTDGGKYGGCSFDFGCGTVFSVTPRGRLKVLHSFAGNGADGASPQASLIEVKGTFYGTTPEGGNGGCSFGFGCGTVFSITPSGVEKVLHTFGNGTDGSEPEAPLIEVKGTLYGTTYAGGSNPNGDGTVFSITPGGTEKVLHSFAGKPDGARPIGGLIEVNGTLYGTTEFGGAGPISGNGTVFALTP